MRAASAALLVCLVVLPGSATASPRPPNVVLVVTDDQRWDTLWAMPVVSASLLPQGVTFTNAFVPTAVCCPSRASILSGLYAHTHGVHTLGPLPHGGAQRFVGGDASTVATWLQAGGYRTGLFGKYLNGYDAFRPPSGTPWYVPPGWDEWQVFPIPAYYNYELVDAAGEARAYGRAVSDYSTDVLRDLVLAFMRESLGSDRPFFVLFAPFAPHNVPFGGQPTPASRHAGSFAGLPPFRPPSFMEADVSDKPIAIREGQVPAWFTPDWLDGHRQLQLESMLAVDEAVAAMLATLREYGQEQDTVVILISDNGYALGEHRLLAKPCAYEECHRVPLVVSYPAALGEPGRMDKHLVLNIDIAPTIADLAGVQHPAVEGHSLAPFVRGRRVRWRRAFPLESWRLNGPQAGALDYRGVRTARWSYVEYPETGERELYDLVADPYELGNLAQVTTAARLGRLRRRMLALHAGD